MTALVLLPGMMCDARLFAPQIAALSARHTLHLPPMVGAETMSGLAAAVLAKAPPRFALVGLSMGGILAMEIMAQAAERVTHLALLDTNPLADATPEARDRQIAAVRAGGLRDVMRDEMKPRYLAAGPGRGAVLDLCMEMAEALGPEVFVAQSLALQSRPDQRATLRAVRVPSLVLCGAEDTVCPPERHEMMRDLIPGACLRVIPGAGHLPVLEQPKATNEALFAWLSQ